MTRAVRVMAAVSLGAAALLLAVHAPGGARVGGAPNPMDQRHEASVQSASSGGNLIDHGGKIIPGSHTYAIFWGSQTAWPSDVQSGMATFFQGLNSTSFLNTVVQYMRGSSVSSSFGGSRTDTSSPSKNAPSTSTIANEVARVYGTNLDTSGIYFVFTSNFPRNANYCAWHSYGTIGGKAIAIAYMPNTTGVAGCDPGNRYGLSGSQGLRSLANVTSHEFMEAITDSSPGSSTYAWIDAAGAENGDKCAWNFTGPVTFSNGSVWQLQTEWSNAVSGCVETT